MVFVIDVIVNKVLKDLLDNFFLCIFLYNCVLLTLCKDETEECNDQVC